MSEDRAVWDAAFINNLPDSAFAVILPGGEKDDDGKTVPRSLRKLPHHGADGQIDLAHLRNALSREPQTTMPEAMHNKARAHLDAHAKTAKVGQNTHSRGAIERRVYEAELRITDATDDEGPHIRGYAAVFDELSLPIGGMFQERLAPGAFKKALRGKPDIRALFNHDPNFVLGRTTAKTLQLSQDETGLAVDITPPETQWAHDLMVSMQRGDISQMSFGFKVGKDEWKASEDGKLQVRTVLEVSELLDVSPVTFPAYPQTSVQARSALAESGIDLDALEAALVRLRSGPNDDDAEQVRTAIAALEAALPLPDPITPHERVWRPALLRRQLALLKLAR